MEIGTAAASAGGEVASKKVVRLLVTDVQRRIDLRFLRQASTVVPGDGEQMSPELRNKHVAPTK